MWGHTYVESIDAFVLYIVSLCFAIYDMDLTDDILSRTTSMSFGSMC